MLWLKYNMQGMRNTKQWIKEIENILGVDISNDELRTDSLDDAEQQKTSATGSSQKSKRDHDALNEFEIRSIYGLLVSQNFIYQEKLVGTSGAEPLFKVNCHTNLANSQMLVDIAIN